ncbi:hypothetical protein N7447_009202 [Penicillium robsamsonii]|uniref:uncharacterized protein n=1 Tax=Penicillium robsamsonii TaxID=1792511 RepID=UPI0025493DF9|nr:uncharacterized protein N7447_009202 [Penicillium robsamsonii]KAJ5816969.1 hypothetical protein N7447_009202 [Penicillium robsamsonii]
MPEMEAHPVLPKMIGETITAPSPNLLDSTLYPRRDWVVIEKLSEYPRPVTPKDFDDGVGPAYTAGKYLCRLAGSRDHGKLAFMHIYEQIPLVGTELDNLSVRKAQASQPRGHTRTTLSPADIIHLIWENVREYYPLNIEEFWSLPYSRRESIRFLLVLNSPAWYKYLSIKAKDLKSEQKQWKW